MLTTSSMGQNPTSGVLSLQRRREIYALSQKYDILIVEDDPYWYLQFPSATSQNTTTTSDPANTSFNPDVTILTTGEPRPEHWKSSGFDFLDSLVPSYINIDTDGRVLRLDSFSSRFSPDELTHSHVFFSSRRQSKICTVQEFLHCPWILLGMDVQ